MQEAFVRLKAKYWPDHLLGEILSKRWTETAIPVIVLIIVAIALSQAIDSLPERERLVMSLYYTDGLNLKEIGAVLKVTESRACQLHGQALVRLKARLADWRDGRVEALA